MPHQVAAQFCGAHTGAVSVENHARHLSSPESRVQIWYSVPLRHPSSARSAPEVIGGAWSVTTWWNTRIRRTIFGVTVPGQRGSRSRRPARSSQCQSGG